MELPNPVGHCDNEAVIEANPRKSLDARSHQTSQNGSDKCLRQALNYSTIAREVDYLHKRLQRPVEISDIVKHFLFSHEEGIKSCERTALIAFSAKIDCLIFVCNISHRRDCRNAGYQNTASWDAFLREAETMFERCSIWILMEFISDQIRVAQTNAEDLEFALFVLGSAWSYYKDKNLSLFRHASVE